MTLFNDDHVSLRLHCHVSVQRLHCHVLGVHALLLALLEANSHREELHEVTKCVMDVQALGTRCMSAEATERPKFDEILRLVDGLDVD